MKDLIAEYETLLSVEQTEIFVSLTSCSRAGSQKRGSQLLPFFLTLQAVNCQVQPVLAAEAPGITSPAHPHCSSRHPPGPQLLLARTLRATSCLEQEESQLLSTEGGERARCLASVHLVKKFEANSRPEPGGSGEAL